MQKSFCLRLSGHVRTLGFEQALILVIYTMYKSICKSVRMLLFSLLLHAVTSILTMGSSIHASLSKGRILRLDNISSEITAQVLHGHFDDVYSILPLSCRTMSKQWLPAIIGRSNVIDKYTHLLQTEEMSDEAQKIRSSMVGRTTQLLVSLGLGYHGIAGKVEPLATGKDFEDNFLLLWMVSF